MSEQRSPFVHAASLRLATAVDPAAVGAAVTVELCGHWDHEGGCRWPHYNEIEVGTDSRTAMFRTLFIALPSAAAEVRERIDQALRASPEWVVTQSGPREFRSDEEDLAGRLSLTPPLSG